MKLIENISQRLFIRTNDGTGYDVILEGDISLSCNTQNDKIWVCCDVYGVVDNIDISTVLDAESYIKSYIDKGVGARIIIIKNNK